MYCEKCDKKMRKITMKVVEQKKDRVNTRWEHIGYWCTTCKVFTKVEGL